MIRAIPRTPTGPMEPGGHAQTGLTSSGSAGRASALERTGELALVERVVAPHEGQHGASGPMKTSDLMVAAGSIPRNAETSAIVRAPGVATSSAPAPAAGDGAATPRASSTLAAWPQPSQRATSSSPAATGP